MSTSPQISRVSLSDDSNATFMLRWRGKQEGPFTAAVVEAKLGANQIGLLHEVFHNGQWVTLRDYFAERDAMLRAERQAREEEDRQAREAAERQAKAREDQRQAGLLAEERRKNDLLQASLAERQNAEFSRSGQPIVRKQHRAGTIITLSLIGLIVFGPLCVAAWVMGNHDLREMDLGIMDNSGRSITTSGRTIGIVGTVLWIIGVILLLIF